jgi:transposase
MNSDDFTIRSIRLGALPIINKYIHALAIESILEQLVPADPRDKIPVWKTLSIILRNIILERYPLYQIGEWAVQRDLISPLLKDCMTDDRIGRSLDRLFKTDRASFITMIILKAIEVYNINVERCHNDSTTVTLFGDYSNYEDTKAVKPRRGKNKDYRPDLKQLLFSLTTAGDHAIPLYFKAWDGNITDDITHIRNWNALRNLTGTSKFTYVADSKLCVRESLIHIDTEGGKFVTVIPETRNEIAQFKQWIQSNTPQWNKAISEPNPRGKDLPLRIFWTFDSPFHSSEGFRIVWIKSLLKEIEDQQRRASMLEATQDALHKLSVKKHRSRDTLEKEIKEIFSHYKTSDFFEWQISVQTEETYKQMRRGRPDGNMTYHKINKTFYQLTFCQNSAKILFESRYDGIFPLISNLDNSQNTAASILDIYKYQPKLEKRFEQLKSVYNVAPVFLQNTQRIESLLLLYFVALLITSLIERTVRIAMADKKLKSIPIYPEERACKSPTADKILALFEEVRMQYIEKAGKSVKSIPDSLSQRQKLVLSLLDISDTKFYFL